MDSISPLAKILAEANGIDWRSIQGSGDGGSVVEQDILNYLSRIMSGDEEPPATPVDEAPPGWTGEMPPMPSMTSGLQALSAAGVESDITDFVAQQAQSASAAQPEAVVVRPVEPEAPATLPEAEEFDAAEFEVEAPDGPADEVDEDLEFELDDDLNADEAATDVAAAAEAPAEPVFQSEPAYDPVALDAEADFVMADEYTGAETTEVVPAEVMAAQVADEPAPQTAEVEAPPAASGFGLGGFLSRLYGAKTEPAEETRAPEPTIGSAHSEPFVSPMAEAPAPNPVLSAPISSEPVLGEPLTSQAPPIPDTPVAAPLVADQWRDQEAEPVAADATAEPVYSELGQPIALPEAHEGGLEAEAPVATPQPEPVESAYVEPVAPAPAIPQPVTSELVHREPAPAEQPVVPTSLPVAADYSGAQAVTLRLNVDLTVLEGARGQLSEALFREVPLGLLVARAAARSLATLGLTSAGGVALADHAGQPLAADLTGDFRASLDGLKQPAQAAPALLVLNAAELGLDELHRGAYSLSVGRSGPHGPAALSLRGELDPVRGAQFLHEVSGLLDAPIRLLF